MSVRLPPKPATQTNKQYYKEFKSNAECISCGEDRYDQLQFHHKDPLNKVAAVSNLTSNQERFDRLRREIEKCEVLCDCCHKAEHRQNRRWYENRVALRKFVEPWVAYVAVKWHQNRQQDAIPAIPAAPNSI